MLQQTVTGSEELNITKLIVPHYTKQSCSIEGITTIYIKSLMSQAHIRYEYKAT